MPARTLLRLAQGEELTTMRSNSSVRYCRCGARLARDNPDTRCSPCQQKARDLALRPPQAPPELWDTERMRDALVARHIGRVVRAYRHHPFHECPLSQGLVGGWLGIGQAQLSRVEHGPPITDLDKLTYWAQILRIPPHLLWFDLPGQSRHAPRPAADRVGDGDAMMVWLVQTLADPDGRERPVLVPMRLSRRKVLAAGGAGLLGALDGSLDPDELARVEAAIVTPSRTDLATVNHLEALLARYRRLDDQLGPRRLLVPVQATLDLVDHLGKDARSPVRQALLSVSAQYEQLVGWLHTDSGGHALAQRTYDRAIARATEAGDQALAGYVLACKSEQTRYAGHTDTAVELAQAAQRGEWRLTPVVRARAADWEARAQALDGKRDECKRKLDEAAELLAESARGGRAEEPPWISHFVEEQLGVHRGICLTDLGEASPAVEVFDHALAALPADRIRDRAYYLACSAEAHLGNGDPEQAAAVAQEGAQIAISTGSGRILEKLRGLHAELSKEHKDVRGVQEFGELLHPASATPHE